MYCRFGVFRSTKSFTDRTSVYTRKPRETRRPNGFVINAPSFTRPDWRSWETAARWILFRTRAFSSRNRFRACEIIILARNALFPLPLLFPRAEINFNRTLSVRNNYAFSAPERRVEPPPIPLFTTEVRFRARFKFVNGYARTRQNAELRNRADIKPTVVRSFEHLSSYPSFLRSVNILVA